MVNVPEELAAPPVQSTYMICVLPIETLLLVVVGSFYFFAVWGHLDDDDKFRRLCLILDSRPTIYLSVEVTDRLNPRKHYLAPNTQQEDL